MLVTGAWREAKAYIEELEAMGHCVIFQQQESEPLACPAQEVEGVICNGLFLYHPIEKFTSLRYIQLTSAGYDRVPLDTIRERGIELHNAADVYSTPMAEFALGGVLQLYKRFDTFRSNQRQHHWEKQRNLLELSGKTVCIVGCGNVGKACAKRFAAFDTRVIGVTAHPRSIDWFEDICGLDELDEVLKVSDIIILALPLTEETRHLIDERRFEMMKQNALLVNIARGAVVDTEALVRALEDRMILGAVLDVMEEEPLPADSKLWDMEQVVLTPHNSFVGEGNGTRLAAMVKDNLKRVLL